MKKLLPLLLLAFFASLARGQINAASCNFSDVNAVINGPIHTVVNGDTINIPSGTCTWNSTLNPPPGVSFTLQGAGTPNSTPSTFGPGTLSTIIIDNAGNGSAMINVSGLIGSNPLMRISTLDIEPPTAAAATFSPISIAGGCSTTEATFRIDNIGFGVTTPWQEANVSATGDAMIRADSVFGVLDHSSTATGNDSEVISTNQSCYLGMGQYGDNSWAQPDSVGTANNVFVENNHFSNKNTVTETEFGTCGSACIGGSRVVGRFNLIDFQSGGFVAFSGHGLESDGRPRGMRQVEAYNNTITCPTGGSCNTAVVSYRSGGTGYVYNNLINQVGTPTVSFTSIFLLNAYRTVFTASPWGACGGSAPWDTNDTNGGGGNTAFVYFTGTVTAASNPSPNFGWNLTMTDTSQSWTTNQFIPFGAPFSVYDVTQGWWGEIASNTGNTITVDESIGTQSPYGFHVGDTYKIQRAFVCGDQGGRGAGALVSGLNPTPVGPFNEALRPIYEGNDAMNSVAVSVAASSSLRMVANRDYYAEAMNQTAQTSPTSPFNGTTGTGHGTLANRPTTCTTGVGYLATDQGNWNQSGLACTGSGTGAGQGCQGQWSSCTSTNTWTNAPQPYTYPNPLITGGGGGTNFSFSIVQAGNGFGTFFGCNPGSYPNNSQISCTAVPWVGSTLAWSGVSGCSTSPTCTFSITVNTVLTLTYTIGTGPYIDAQANNGVVPSTTLNLAVTAGHNAYAELFLPGPGNSGANLTATDSQGNVWTTITSGNLTIDGDTIAIICAPVANTGTDTITANAAGVATTMLMIAYDVGNSSCTSDQIAPPNYQSTTTAPTSNPVTTTLATDFLLGAIGVSSPSTSPLAIGSGPLQTGGGFINPQSVGSSAGGTNYYSFFGQAQAPGATGTYTSSINAVPAGEANSLLVAFSSNPTCGNPTQLPPNFSNYPNSYPASSLPLSLGFSSPTPGCVMRYTSAPTNLVPAPTCASPTYPTGGFTITTSGIFSYRVIACQLGYTSSAVQGGIWQVAGAPTYSFSVSSSGTGGCTFSGSGCSNGSSIPSGTPISCLVTPVPGSAFSLWTGTGSAQSGTANPNVFNLGQNSTLVATCNQLSAASPTASPCNGAAPCGTYNSPVTVTLADRTAGATITYAVSITLPCTPSLTYSVPFTLNHIPTQYVCAFATASGYAQSPTVTFNYTLLQPPTNVQGSIIQGASVQ